MNTPAHLIFGLAAFGRPGAPAIIAAALAGAIIPDLSLYLLSGWHLAILGTSPEVVFRELYYSEGWQAIFRIDNSIPLWTFGLAVALIARSGWGIALCGAALLHLVLDFPLHNDDARAHFWPFTNWKFISPVSYWDPQYHGRIVAPIEVVAALAACVLIWRRFSGWLVRGLTVLLGAMQLAPALAWAMMFG